MALSASGKGSGGNATGATSIGIVPTSNCTDGALLILAIGYDNAGTNGSDPYSSISDDSGNTWTVGAYALCDPGAANAGVAFRLFYSYQDVATLTTSSTITVSFGSTSVTNKRWTLTQLTAATGYYAYTSGSALNNVDGDTQGDIFIDNDYGYTAGYSTASQVPLYGDYPNSTSKCLFVSKAMEGNVTQWDSPPSSGASYSVYQTSSSTNMSIGSACLINYSSDTTWSANGSQASSMDQCAGGVFLTETLLPASSQDPFGQFGIFGI